MHPKKSSSGNSGIAPEGRSPAMLDDKKKTRAENGAGLLLDDCLLPTHSVSPRPRIRSFGGDMPLMTVYTRTDWRLSS